jgi:uncharacterized caspase-like protein
MLRVQTTGRQRWFETCGDVMRKIVLALTAFVSLAFASQAALADKRVALVIGNSTYQNAPQLANPAKDAAAIADMLRKAEFEVVESVHDVNNSDMRRSLREFSDKAQNADVAVVYFAGHGIEVDGQNYLIPTDAALQRDRDVYDEAISLDRILQTVEPAKSLRLVILDACRDNPFAKSMKRVTALRSLGRGLIAVEPMKTNTLIAYAAKGGSTAEDGDGKNSPFATALLKHLPTPGLDLRQAFGMVRDDVMQATDNKQEPFVYGSLGGATIALVQTASLAATTPAAAAAAAVVPATPNPQADIRRDYEYAERVGTREAWESFLKSHTSGFYADLARAQLSKLTAEQASSSAAAKAKQAVDEKARLQREGAAPADQAKAAADAKAAEQTKLAAEKARKREQARVAAAERKKRREEARIAAQSRAVALPVQRHNAGPAATQQNQARSGTRVDRASLYARCDAQVPRGARDDDVARPPKIEFCINNGGRY